MIQTTSVTASTLHLNTKSNILRREIFTFTAYTSESESATTFSGQYTIQTVVRSSEPESATSFSGQYTIHIFEHFSEPESATTFLGQYTIQTFTNLE
jgi:hypothetical protein